MEGLTMESRGTPARPEEFLAQSAWARRLAHSLVGEAAAADDVVQETWMAALERPPDGERPLRPWLARVIANFARQRARSGSRRDARERSAARPEALPGPDELVERLDSQRALAEELGRLAEPQRSTVLLRYFEDLEPSEIARRQGIPAGTVRWRLKRGLDELRLRLDARFGERRTWALLLVPLARPVVPPSPLLPSGPEGSIPASAPVVTSGGAGAALTGAWIVSTTLKVTAGAAAATLTFLGLAWTGVLPTALSPFARETPAPVVFRPLTEMAEVEGEAPAPSPAAVETARRSAETAPEPVAAAEAAPGSTTIALRAGIFDGAGSALSGGRLVLLAPFEALSGPSAADGSATLELDGEQVHQQQLVVRVERTGFASALAHVHAEPGSEVHMGNFRLEPGGAISGRVLDADGRGMHGVLISLGGTDDEPERLEMSRYDFWPELLSSTRSGPDGSFVVAGVPEGYHRVWASADDWVAAFSAPVEVRAGQESTGVELVLSELAAAHLVLGRVLDPSGMPAPHAELRFVKGHARSSTSSSLHADGEGRFRIVVPPGSTLALTAIDRERAFGPASVEGLRGGVSDLELRLSALSRAELWVAGSDGAPLERFAWRTLAASDESHLAEGHLEAHAGGRVELDVPTVPFLLEVSAPGHTLERLGPWTAAAVGERIDVRLAPLPGLRGRVLMEGGERVEGARVQLFTRMSDERYYEHNGFEVYLEPSALDEDSSDDGGRFLLTPRTADTYFVRVERAGFAPAEVGPLELVPERAGDELTIELGHGGAIEGRVLAPPGPEAAGSIVGISRGDGHAVTQRTGPDGSFRFELLTPGNWQVRVVTEEIHPSRSMSTSTTARGRPEMAWDCRVEEGRTTRFDIDLGDRGDVRVSGLLRIDGAEPGAWKAVLTSERLFGGARLDEADVSLAGEFELSAPRPGRYLVMLEGAFGERGMQILAAKLELGTGDNPWQLDLRTSALEVANVPALEGSDPATVHLWTRGEELMCLTAVFPDENGRCLLPRVPVGPGRIVNVAGDDPEPLAWPTLAECEVVAGKTVQVTLP
jgi:RNA polymerase sigma-70 factor (ECF subfamily)